MKDYYIHNLEFIHDEEKVRAVFYVNDLVYNLCLLGYDDQEKEFEEYGNYIFYSDKDFQDFMIDFFDLYRLVLIRYYKRVYRYRRVRIDDTIFINEVEKAKTKSLNKYEITEYRKLIKTSYKLFA